MNRTIVVAILLAALLFPIALLLLALPLFILSFPSFESLLVSRNPLRGGTIIGIKLAFIGSLGLVFGQLYSVRKRVSRVRVYSVGLTLHQLLGVGSSVLIFLHAGMPFSFKQANPFEYLHFSLGLYGLTGVSGLAAWLVTATLASGVLGWFLRKFGGTAVRRVTDAWRFIHIVLSVGVYISGVLHMTMVLVFKILSGG